MAEINAAEEQAEATAPANGTPASNAERFINAYNDIDYSLRTIYGFKRNITYSDMVRRAVTLNTVVRKYEEKLIDYGRLRNSIVHKSNPNFIIAEPHIDVVEDFEHLAGLIKTPPTVYQKIKGRTVATLTGDTSVREIIELMTASGFANIPVYEGTKLIGIARPSHIITHMGRMIRQSEIIINDYIDKTTLKDILPGLDGKEYFVVADKSLTIESALNYFYTNRKLLVILLTEKGTYNEKPLGIITNADILDLNTVLEDY